MGIPFDYVIFYLMMILNSRNIEMKINTKNLPLIFKNLIDFLPYDDEEKEELKEKFDYDFELSYFVSAYSEYLDMDDKYMTLNMDTDLLNNFINSIKEDYSDYFLDDISSTIDDNYVFLDLLGIKIKKEYFDKLLNVEREVELFYNDFYNKCNDKNYINDLKRLILKRKFLFMCIENNLSGDDYYDLSIYAGNMSIDNDDSMFVPLESDDDYFDDRLLMENPMLKALFYKESLSSYNIAKRMDVNLSKVSGLFDVNDLPELKFYLTFLKFLEEEMSYIDNKELLLEFRTGKYRLMNVLDTVFDTYTIFDDKDYININKIDMEFDYSFIEETVYYFINEVLQYTDSRYEYNDKDFYNLVNYYFNIIKKLLIKTYYYLTDDSRVVEKIKNNFLYGINKISSGMLDDAINRNKFKSKIK